MCWSHERIERAMCTSWIEASLLFSSSYLSFTSPPGRRLRVSLRPAQNLVRVDPARIPEQETLRTIIARGLDLRLGLTAFLKAA